MCWTPGQVKFSNSSNWFQHAGLKTKLNSLIFKFIAPSFEAATRQVVHLRSFGGGSSKPVELRGAVGKHQLSLVIFEIHFCGTVRMGMFGLINSCRLNLSMQRFLKKSFTLNWRLMAWAGYASHHWTVCVAANQTSSCHHLDGSGPKVPGFNVYYHSMKVMTRTWLMIQLMIIWTNWCHGPCYWSINSG